MAENTPPEKPKRGKGRPFTPGVSGNPGGKPKKLREIEAMLDAEHRTVENLREVFATIKKVAMGVEEPVYYKGGVCGGIVKYDGGWMSLYLERVLGPVKDIKIDLSDAPDEVVAYLADKLN